MFLCSSCVYFLDLQYPIVDRAAALLPGSQAERSKPWSLLLCRVSKHHRFLQNP